MSLRTRIGAVLASAVVASGLVVAVPGTANAGAYGCAGKFIKSWPVHSMWRTLGDVRLYYNPKTKTSCAVVVKRKAYRDKKTSMSVRLYNQTWAGDNSNKYNVDTDSGKFKHYAGPVKVRGKSSKGKKYKVTIWADISYGGERGRRDVSGVWSH
ncbi:hypothetical protein [Actinomadura rudentiformis]|uniref:Uncharacterized protein n=1 Tax=Actinomadura rudentiformis TaxID=359158 RepID=A0A6H9YTT2_9ACTN|nr:hypothetical protein [Actinomadura rudentiformis]KAB2347753.1 hypothetical protein F8566_17760 [Actinomadura rudentiformis]